MGSCQSGIFDKRFREHLFVEYVVGREVVAEQVAACVGKIVAAKNEKTRVTLAFGPALWARLPGGFGFSAFALDGLPATQGDLLLWIQGETRADVVDAMRVAHR